MGNFGYDYKLDPPEDFEVRPCLPCMAQGCVRCNFIGYRAPTREEIEQEKLENRQPEN